MEGPVEIRRRSSVFLPPGSLDGLLGQNGGTGIPLQPNGFGPHRTGGILRQPTVPEETEEGNEATAAGDEEDTVLAVNCRVCQTEIIISEEEGFVVKCPACNEATPIRNAPVGEKYVRCPCRCLLVCKDECEKIACPRPNCKRIITIASSAGSQNALHKQGYQAGTVRVLCCHCNEDFLFNVVHKTLAKCPHCGKISSVGNAFRLRQLRVYSCVALLFILITGFVIFATGFLVAESGGIVALYIGLVAISVLALVRVGYFLRMRVSKIQESV